MSSSSRELSRGLSYHSTASSRRSADPRARFAAAGGRPTPLELDSSGRTESGRPEPLARRDTTSGSTTIRRRLGGGAALAAAQPPPPKLIVCPDEQTARALFNALVIALTPMVQAAGQGATDVAARSPTMIDETARNAVDGDRPPVLRVTTSDLKASAVEHTALARVTGATPRSAMCRSAHSPAGLAPIFSEGEPNSDASAHSSQSGPACPDHVTALPPFGGGLAELPRGFPGGDDAEVVQQRRRSRDLSAFELSRRGSEDLKETLDRRESSGEEPTHSSPLAVAKRNGMRVRFRSRLVSVRFPSMKGVAKDRDPDRDLTT